ncbi:ABC transporter permease [Holospora curviuscula]|uniref:Branched-chain amino acid transport system / permease component n=1 Tax=Holospora curviuscula TaxID=1082868 RepID=A0A2S5R7S1_9PROT|nr:ABC transporter permease [Holospora curviuscula]PPE03389.1 Branched-chain amino acid transport system / permease component [Holospora curviuscula]
MTIELLYTGILQGLILAIIAFGIMIPFRFLDFPDLTAEGAYPLGGAVCACLMVAGIPKILAIMGAIIAGGLLAVGTSQVALRLKVNSLLAGIILSTMAYSVNLRIMGKPNIALFEMGGINLDLISLIMVVILCIIPFALFLHTDFGLRFRTIGSNAKFAIKHGISVHKYTSLGLFIAGSMFGLAGSLIVQMQQFMDVGMGVGIVIHGLASLMIGESIVSNRTISKQLAAPIIGALIYQQIQGIALSFGLAPSDLKFFTGSIVLIVLAIQKGGKDVS